MDRRGFLKRLGIGTAAAAAAVVTRTTAYGTLFEKEGEVVAFDPTPDSADWPAYDPNLQWPLMEMPTPTGLTWQGSVARFRDLPHPAEKDWACVVEESDYVAMWFDGEVWLRIQGGTVDA